MVEHKTLLSPGSSMFVKRMVLIDPDLSGMLVELAEEVNKIRRNGSVISVSVTSVSDMAHDREVSYYQAELIYYPDWGR